MAKDTTYRPNVYREQGGNRLTVAASGELLVDGGTLTLARATATEGATVNAESGMTMTVKSGAAVNFQVGSSHKRAVQTATQGLTLTGSDSGKTIITRVANVNHKLPNATGNSGTYYRFVLGTGGLGATGGAGLKVHPKSGDFVKGGGLSATGNKVLQLAGATDAIGDFVEVEGDGAQWMIVGIRGGWTTTTATA